MSNSTIYSSSAAPATELTLTKLTVSANSQSRTSDIIKPDECLLVVNPALSTEGIFFALFGQTAYTGTGDVVGGGHIVGAMGWSALVSNATIAMGIGVEGRYDHNAGSTGTTTQAKAILGLIRNAGGTMTNAKTLAGELQLAADTIVVNAYGAHVSVSMNAGTINKYVGFGMPDMSAVQGIGDKFFFENLDANAPGVSLAPIVDQAYGYAQGANGFVYQLPANISDFQFILAADIAQGTLVLPAPADAIDGQEICVGTTHAIAAFAVNGNGAGVYNPPASLPAGGTVRFKFYGRGVNLWFRR